MNRQEHRALRAIEKNLKADDPELAKLLRSFGDGSWGRIHKFAGLLAVLLLFLGVSSGAGVLLLTGVLLALGVVLKWTAQALR